MPLWTRHSLQKDGVLVVPDDVKGSNGVFWQAGTVKDLKEKL